MISHKRDRGEEYSLIAYNIDNTTLNTINWLRVNSIFSYHYEKLSEAEVEHTITRRKSITCVEETKLLIRMMKKEYFLTQCIPVIESSLPIVERYQHEVFEGFSATCRNCAAVFVWAGENVVLVSITEPGWSICADCNMKYKA